MAAGPMSKKFKTVRRIEDTDTTLMLLRAGYTSTDVARGRVKRFAHPGFSIEPFLNLAMARMSFRFVVSLLRKFL